MHVIIAGGTGFIGRALVEELAAQGHRVTVLSRNAFTSGLGGKANVVRWPAPGWEQVLNGADAVVNLAGEPIADRRWTPERKRRLVESRVDATRAIVEALRTASPRPAVLVNGSAVGYYGPTAQPVDEQARPGSDFLAGVCTAWEEEAVRAEPLGVRVVRLRIGVVLGERGGALGRMLLPFRLFAGGPIGSGKQPFPWIHIEDVVGLICLALENPAAAGAINAVAPELLDNAAFARTLGQVMHRPSWLPVPGFALRLALGEMADAMLLDGQAVLPAAAGRLGYAFRYPRLEGALKAILQA
ncbi:MAG TPA: TIGR01777 family oxidoreductase [Symbiobacteriaceae bacterium]|nr:TIGR01777 family oxidoreductase [Symbiobacteriaceae bacterium]